MDDRTESAPALRSRAAHEELAYIRRTLEAAGRFSIVPGTGMAMIGVLALAAVWIDERVIGGALWSRPLVEQVRHSPPLDGGAAGLVEFAGTWMMSMALWLGVLVASVAIGVATMWAKARRTKQVLWSPVLRKALWGYAAAMLLGGVLTVSMLGRPEMLPELWLGCYGVALVGAGTISISPIRWMGCCFLVLAGVAAFTRLPGSLLIATGFGGLHVGFGAYIAWRHDG